MFSDFDHAMMQRALVLVEKGLFTTTPGPRVGCVAVRDDTVVGEGYTQPVGQNHAEIQAIKDVQSYDQDVRDATAYVTLEPCSHLGRTPPCADRLVEASIARVVVAMEGPNPAVSGCDLQKLRNAGVDVRCGLLEHEACELNIGFVSRMTRDMPWVCAKVGTPLDGRIALDNGVSQQVTEAETHNNGHRWCTCACAILTGIGIVCEDNPRLTVHAVNMPRQPCRVLIDSALDVLFDTHILTADGYHEPTLIFAVQPEAGRMRALGEHGVEVILLPNVAGKVNLAAALRELGRREINELHVEAGFKLNGSLSCEGLVDGVPVYLASRVLDSDRGMFNMGSLQMLEGAAEFLFHDISYIGGDLRILARRSPTD